jgi:hypothetical protein
MLGGPEIKKKWAIETHFPEFKWIFYDFNNNRNNCLTRKKTQATPLGSSDLSLFVGNNIQLKYFIEIILQMRLMI